MPVQIIPTKKFVREAKTLTKKYRSLPSDLQQLCLELIEMPTMGNEFIQGIRKIRLKIDSKGKGKSGGGRVITYLLHTSEESTNIYLLHIYDKSEQETVSELELRNRIFDLSLENDSEQE